ncbi:SrtB family sortase [Paenibacillus psychroresistens]|uniref:SrtB family sortase n=1 Tax=Paenibacillus psychroresistens TaxID=1778678 RepID=A0A6B8RT80_9BACL|nr:class B sortase [Paenibacillus psychroresistens]QGQ98962.1 SrtB family sortase [Paenibacillus psychroresistens]
MSLKMAEERPFLNEEGRVNRVAAHWIKWCVLSIALAVFLFSTYKIVAYVNAGSENKKTYAEIRELYVAGPPKVTQTTLVTSTYQPFSSDDDLHNEQVLPEKKPNPKFLELLKQNAEIVGWIKINSTKIDYPVTQTKDNEFYLDNDVNKVKNPAGSIFMDYRNLADGPNRNIIIYGHDMRTGAMFANLLGYQSKWNFDNKSIIEFDTLYADEKWQIFSAYTTDSQFDYIKTDFRTDVEYLAFLKTIQAKSIHSTSIELTETDTIITLSTCSAASKDARFVVHAKLIKEEL